VGGRAPPLVWSVEYPEPVARACVALLSDWFPATNGEMIHVDGGYHAVGAVTGPGLQELLSLRIGVFGGAGPAGSALGARLASVGYEVVLGSRAAERAQAVAEQL